MLKVKNWKETAKDRRTWRDLAEKEKPHKRVVVPNNDDDEFQTHRKPFKFMVRCITY